MAERMLQRGMASQGIPCGAADLGVVDPHVASGTAVRQELAVRQRDPVPAATPEVWQGQERPLMIVHHPLRGVDPRAFALDPGRTCVSLSRHQYGCVIVTRAGIEDAL